MLNEFICLCLVIGKMELLLVEWEVGLFRRFRVVF